MDGTVALLAIVATIALLVLPGTALLSALRPAAGWVRNLGLAPAVSLGCVWTLATALSVLRLPVTSATVGLPLLLVPALLFVVLRRRHLHDRAEYGLVVDRLDVVGVAIGTTVLLALWWIATSGLANVAPRDDGTHHGLYVARILATGSVDPSDVLVSDVITGQQQWSFYPLATHTLAAVVAGLGVPVGVALNAVWVSITAVALPIGMYVLARRTFPSARRAAVAVALLCGLLPAVPTGQLAWGGLTIVAGLALAPAVVDEVVGLLESDHVTTAAEAMSGVALGLAAVGMFFTHSSVIATVVVMVASLVLGDRSLRPLLRQWRAALVSGLVALGVLVVVTAPWVGDLRAGAGERYLVAPTRPENLGDIGPKLAWYAFGEMPAIVLLVTLTLVGVVAAWRRGAAGWLSVAAAVCLLSAAVGLGLPGASLLSSPWYSNINRTALLLMYPVSALCGFAVWWLARGVRDLLVGPVGRRTAPALGAVVPAVVVLALASVCLPLATRYFSALEEGGHGRSLATPDARASWAWLAERVGPDQRVLNEFQDGSGWMYAVDDVAPVFPSKLEATGLTGDKVYLLENAARVASDPRARAIADELGVRYAYVGPRTFPESLLPWFTADSLEAGGWTVVQRTPTTVVLEIPPSTTVAASTA